MVTAIATLYARLEEAEHAYHRLMMGDREVTVSVGGFGATTYAQVDSDKLKSYIDTLKGQIAVMERSPRRGPLLIRF